MQIKLDKEEVREIIIRHFINLGYGLDVETDQVYIDEDCDGETIYYVCFNFDEIFNKKLC